MSKKSGFLTRLALIGLFVWGSLLSVQTVWAVSNPSDYFRIRVTNQQGQGVPMIEVRTTNGKSRVTDSRGVVAFREPGLMGKTVRFTLDSPPPGYELVNPGIFGGTRLKVVKGSTGEINVRRTTNVARRLFRLTGPGIYRDSVLVGDGPEVPISDPLSNAQVAVIGVGNQAVFRDRLFWFWDAAIHLDGKGQFKIVGAQSQLPRNGGLDPVRGVNLDFFDGTGEKTRSLFSSNLPFLANLESLMVTESSGHQRMFAYFKMSRPNGSLVKHGILEWNPSHHRFDLAVEFPKTMSPNLCRNVTRVRAEGRNWFYFNCPYPIVRVPAEPSALTDPGRFESFTPLAPGTTLSDPMIASPSDGSVWDWRPKTGTVTDTDQIRFVKDGILGADQGVFYLTDLVTGDSVTVTEHGTVVWNEFRKKWILIATQVQGRSGFGEVWYAEADSPIGPWVYARRVVTHRQDRSRYNQEYSFVGTNQHPYFEDNSGETVFFSGLYNQLNTNSRETSRYNQNILMYALHLKKDRLKLPSPVYQYRDDRERIRYGTASSVPQSIRASPTVRFYGLPPDRARSNSVAVWAHRTTVDGHEAVRLTTSRPDHSLGGQPVFYAASSQASLQQPHVVPLYEYVNQQTGQLLYSPPSFAPSGSDWSQSRGPIARVWRSPRLDPPSRPFSEPVRTCMGASAHCSPVF